MHTTLRRWAEEAFAGLPDKSRAPHRRGTKVTLRAMTTVRELQENPLLGEFRIHAALKRLGIFLSPRTCGRILALNRTLSGLPKPEPVPREPQPMPFQAVRRHQSWSADIRYLDHGLGGCKVYSITILDNSSRAVVASGLSRTQDLGTFLMVLIMAIQQHGAPEALVTDGGSVFRAKQLLTILERLGIQKHEIARRQAWQNSVEALFGVQRRMVDRGFLHAGSWPELLAVHDLWVADDNEQDHFAHQERPEDRRSPAAVLHHVWHARRPGGTPPHLLLHPLRPSTRSGGLRPLPALARLRRAGPRRRAGGGLAVCRALDASLSGRAAGAVPRHVPAGPAPAADGDASAAVRDPASLAATAAVDVGGGRVVARAAAASLRTTPVTDGRCGAAAPRRAGGARRLSRVERDRHAACCPTTGAAVKTLANSSRWP